MWLVGMTINRGGGSRVWFNCNAKRSWTLLKCGSTQNSRHLPRFALVFIPFITTSCFSGEPLKVSVRFQHLMQQIMFGQKLRGAGGRRQVGGDVVFLLPNCPPHVLFGVSPKRLFFMTSLLVSSRSRLQAWRHHPHTHQRRTTGWFDSTLGNKSRAHR